MNNQMHEHEEMVREGEKRELEKSRPHKFPGSPVGTKTTARVSVPVKTSAQGCLR